MLLDHFNPPQYFLIAHIAFKWLKFLHLNHQNFRFSCKNTLVLNTGVTPSALQSMKLKMTECLGNHINPYSCIFLFCAMLVCILYARVLFFPSLGKI